MLIGKPLVIKSFTWATGNAAGTVIDRANQPTDLISVSPIAAVPFNVTAFYQMRGKAVIHLPGTAMHSGILLAAAVPCVGTASINLNMLLCCPHAFIYANQASSVEVELPFYNNTRFRNTPRASNTQMSYDYANYVPTNRSDYLSLVLYVVSPLQASGAGSVSIVGNIEFVFDHIDFRVPVNNQAAYLPAQAQSMTFGDFDTVPETSGVEMPAPPMPDKPADVQAPPDIPVSSNKDNSPPAKDSSITATITRAFDGAAGYAKTVTGDLIDAARMYLRSWTGLHSFNKSNNEVHMYSQHRTGLNTVDSVVTFEKAFPYSDYNRITDDYYFFTDCDEMNVNYLMQKIQHVTSFPIKQADVRGTLLMARPITPYMSVDPATGQFTSIHTKLALLSQAWSGDLEIILQASMSNFQQCKLFVALDYNPTASALTQSPSMDSLRGCPNYVLEYGGGGSEHTILLPYFSMLQHVPVPPYWAPGALTHGMMYVFVLEPLTVGDNQPTTVYMNAYLRGKPNTQLYGFNTRMFSDFGPLSTVTAFEEAEPQSGKGCLSEMDNVTCQDKLNDEPDLSKHSPTRGGLRPIVDLRDHLRRLYCAASSVSLVANSSRNTVTFSLFDLVVRNLATNNSTPLYMLYNMFRLHRIGFRVKIIGMGAQNMSAMYIPPLPALGTFTNFASTTPSINDGTRVALASSFPITPLTSTYPTVVMDAANYAYPSRGSVLVQGSTTSQSVCELDFEIPFMSYLETVGSIAQQDSMATLASASDDLGQIIVSFIPTILEPSSAGEPITEPQNFACKVYLGCDDFTRFGMQTFTTPFTLSYISAGNENVVTFNQGPGAVGSFKPSVQAPRAWYTIA